MRDTYPQVQDEFVTTGKIRYAVLDYPLRSHPHAFKAAEAAACAMDNGKYWEMHDLLFANARLMAPEDLKQHGATLGLDQAAFDACLDEAKYAAQIQASLEEGIKAGVRGTPSFFIGKTDPATPGKIKATKFVRGAQPFEVFQKNIDEVAAQGS